MLYGIVLLGISMAGCGRGEALPAQAVNQIQGIQALQTGREGEKLNKLESVPQQLEEMQEECPGNDGAEDLPVKDLQVRDRQAEDVLVKDIQAEAVQVKDTQAEIMQLEGRQAVGVQAGSTHSDNVQAEGESSDLAQAEAAPSELEQAEEAKPEEEERELTDKELKKLQWSLRSTENGFFACLYDRPEEIDWEQVFYLGAGMNVALNEGQLDIIRENVREEIRQEREKEEELWYQYLSANSLFLEEQEEGDEEAEEEEIEVNLAAGNVTTLTLRSIQNFVKNKTGMDYSEARKPLRWPSLTRNVFYFVHEGTNRVTVKLISAKVKGNVYTLYYRKDNKRGQTEPEYVMTAEIEGNKWKYLSNLSLKQAPPITLLDIDFYGSGEMARLQGTKEMIMVTQEEREEQVPQTTPAQGNKKTTAKAVAQAPKSYWAVITAREDNTILHVENAYLGDDVSSSLAEEGYFIAADTIASVVLQKGEKIGLRVALEDIPKCRIWASSGSYYGEYAFGSENDLKRVEEDGTPKSTYVLGRDLDGEGRGTSYQTKEELLSFLKGTWVYYDSTMGDYTAKLCFDGENGFSIAMPGLTYHLTASKWNRVYVDEKGAPDVVTFQSGDETTQELITLWYPAIKKKMGDYRIRAIQRDGMQILYLTPENAGVGCLNYLLPGADEGLDEFVFYRFVGASQEEAGELENTKG